MGKEPPIHYLCIAGSAAETCNKRELEEAHILVRRLVVLAGKAGWGMVLFLSGEPRAEDVPLIYEWTVLEEVFRLFDEKKPTPKLRVIVASDARRIPDHRALLWSRVRELGAEFEYIDDVTFNGGDVRRMQAKKSDCVVGIAGGKGVAHLFKLAQEKGAACFPVKTQLGAGAADGSGSNGLFRELLRSPSDFLRETGRSQLECGGFELPLLPEKRAASIFTLLQEELAARLERSPAPLALVMKGGGVKGLAYVGALEILEQKYEFNWFVGTSAGAITAILLAAGFTPKDLKEILRTKEFTDFFDAKWAEIPGNLLFRKGIHTGEAFTNWLDELLANKLQKKSRVTLADLTHRVTVYASQRGRSALVFDSGEKENDNATKNSPSAAYVARCSMSIPLVFTPQQHQGIFAYDGGLQHNYPIRKLLEAHPDLDFVSLYLGSPVYEPPRKTGPLADLPSIWSEAEEPELVDKYRKQTIVIDPRPVETLDFGLSDSEKDFLLSCGRVAALNHTESEELDIEKCKHAALRNRVCEERKSKGLSPMMKLKMFIGVLLGLTLSAGLVVFGLAVRGLEGIYSGEETGPVHRTATPSPPGRVGSFSPRLQVSEMGRISRPPEKGEPHILDSSGKLQDVIDVEVQIDGDPSPAPLYFLVQNGLDHAENNLTVYGPGISKGAGKIRESLTGLEPGQEYLVRLISVTSDSLDADLREIRNDYEDLKRAKFDREAKSDSFGVTQEFPLNT